MGKEMFLVDKETLYKLMLDRLKLSALEEGGVDNWIWYGESMSTYMNLLREEKNEEDMNIAIHLTDAAFEVTELCD